MSDTTAIARILRRNIECTPGGEINAEYVAGLIAAYFDGLLETALKSQEAK